MLIGYILVGISLLFMVAGIRIVRPIEVGLVETFGKYNRTATQGFNWIIPIVQRMIYVNLTERMVDIPPQMVITSDKLNAEVDAVVYYQIKDPKKSQYNVNNHKKQLTSLARTTLRAVVGKMSLSEANEQRDKINSNVERVLDKETDSYGVNVLRVEIQKIEPPQDVQKSMNMVVKAEQEKIAALDIATAAETQADGDRRAKIKIAQGFKQAAILEAEGKAQAIVKVADADANRIKVVNQSLITNFKGDAQLYQKLLTTEAALKNGTKFVIDSKSNLVNVMSDSAGIPLPIKTKKW